MTERKVEEGTLNDHEDSVQCLAFTADSKYMLSGSSDCSFKIWS